MKCVRRWDGCHESVFRLSTQTCIGYEVGWDFICSVETSGQSFSGYLATCNARCKRRNKDTRGFVSVPIFIKWFFAWISQMKIDFRQQCQACGGSSKFLACDGTKLGITLKNAFIKPIETPENGPIVETRLKRLNRCFIRK